MSTEATSRVTTPSGSTAKYACWLAAVVGLWVLVSPFVLSGAIGTGTPMYATVVAGLLVVVLSGFAAYAIRTGAETAAFSTPEIAAWLAALVGLWVLVSPFVLSGTIASGTPMWSSVGAGIVVAILAGYVGFERHGVGE